MSDVILVNYCDHRNKSVLTREVSFQISQATKVGINHIINWGRKDLESTGFYEEHREILDEPRGAGFWLWKPYIILDTLNKANDGDIVIYSDVDIYFLTYPSILIEICEEFGYFFRRSLISHITHTKRDCLVEMGADSERWYNRFHITSGFQFLKKTETSIRFVKLWLHWCCKKNIIDDSSSGHELPTFKDHRHDLSIFSILHSKSGLLAFNSPGITMNDFLNAGLYNMAFNDVEKDVSVRYYPKQIIGGQI